MTEPRTQNELVLSPGEYAFTQDLTSGIIKVHTGPSVVNATNQEYPVSFDSATRKFKRVDLTAAAQQFVIAQQGQYIVLTNPATDEKQPDVRSKSPAAQLEMGQKVIMQGPRTIALWPGQSAQVVDGHNLRSNQYLLIRVYDELKAKDNWTKGVIKAISTAENIDPSSAPKTDAKPTTAKADEKRSLFTSVPNDLAVGKQYIVKGDEFSFYIPPTGVEVVQAADASFVRDAITLERLEYCILIDENGSKRYERGPMVVFPMPTERFLEQMDKQGKEHIVFQPIELNEIQGVHVKVISSYKDDAGVERKEGDELFIKGTETPIYFPRPEHALLSYDGKHKHFATAVPGGEGRYVLNRKEGTIDKMVGPTMLLPDPRNQVIVRRVLSDRQCKLWYPGNMEAQRYNAALRELRMGASATRGAVSEGEVNRSKKVRTKTGLDTMGFGDKSTTHSDTLAIGAEELERSATYTEPRTLTLDTKFSGVPIIEVQTGYAVMLVNKDVNRPARRVEIGPKALLLDYDEQLEVLKMSTGKPKTTENLIETVYLRVKNNQIGDVFSAETRDHVSVTFKVSLRGDFTGDPNKWFEVENYVKLVSDHIRSIAKADIRRRKIEELYADPTGFIRDAILGVKGADGSARKGMLFEENGFKLEDVEVLDFKVGDDRIAKMLDATQHNIVEGNIGLALAEKRLELDRRNEEIERERLLLKAETTKSAGELQAELQKLEAQLAAEKVTRDLELVNAKLTAEQMRLEMQQKTSAADQKLKDENAAAELRRRTAEASVERTIKQALQELELAKTKEETAQVVARFTAAGGSFSEALVALGSQETLVKVAQALNIQDIIGGKNLSESLAAVFRGTPLESVATALQAKSMMPAHANGDTRTRS